MELEKETKVRQLLFESDVINWRDILNGPFAELLEIIMEAMEGDTTVLHNYWCFYRLELSRERCMQYVADEVHNILNDVYGDDHKNILIAWIEKQPN